MMAKFTDMNVSLDLNELRHMQHGNSFDFESLCYCYDITYTETESYHDANFVFIPVIKSPRYTRDDFMFLYLFVRRHCHRDLDDLVTKVRCKDLLDSDRGDFRCRRAFDSSSYKVGFMANVTFHCMLKR